jgi:hypothetical protein
MGPRRFPTLKKGEAHTVTVVLSQKTLINISGAWGPKELSRDTQVAK